MKSTVTVNGKSYTRSGLVWVLEEPQPQIPRRKAGFQATPDIGSSVYLECRPPLDRKDRNPVVKTFVNLSFKNGDEVQEFTVIHELFDGRKIDRSNQYTGTVAHVPSGGNVWSWSGRLDRNPRITMEARAFLSARNEWWYEENVFDNGRSDSAILYQCNKSEGGDQYRCTVILTGRIGFKVIQTIVLDQRDFDAVGAP